jgi:hypothetical protein
MTLTSQNGTLLQLVREFAEGLGWMADPAAPSAIICRRPENTASPDDLLNLLTYVALSATKAGVDPSEPLCRIVYRQGEASQVTLGIRIADFDLSA